MPLAFLDMAMSRASRRAPKEPISTVTLVAILVSARTARSCTSLLVSLLDTSDRVSSRPLWEPIRSAVSSHARLVRAPAARRRALSFGSELTVFLRASKTTPDPYVTSRVRFSLEKARFCNAVTAYSLVSALSSMTDSFTRVPSNRSFLAMMAWLSGVDARSMRAWLAYSLAPSDRSRAATLRTDSTRPVCSSMAPLLSSGLARLASTRIRMVRHSALRIDVDTRTRAARRPWWRTSVTRSSVTRLKYSSTLVMLRMETSACFMLPDSHRSRRRRSIGTMAEPTSWKDVRTTSPEARKTISRAAQIIRISSSSSDMDRWRERALADPYCSSALCLASSQ